MQSALNESEKARENKSGEKILKWLELIETNSKLKLNDKAKKIEKQIHKDRLNVVIAEIRADVKNNIIDENLARNVLQQALINFGAAAKQNQRFGTSDTANAVNSILTSLKLRSIEDVRDKNSNFIPEVSQNPTVQAVEKLRKKLKDLDQDYPETCYKDKMLGWQSLDVEGYTENGAVTVLNQADALLEKLEKLFKKNKMNQATEELGAGQEILSELQKFHDVVITPIRDRQSVETQASRLLSALNDIDPHKLSGSLQQSYIALQTRLKQFKAINKVFGLDDKIDDMKIIYNLRNVPTNKIFAVLSQINSSIEKLRKAEQTNVAVHHPDAVHSSNAQAAFFAKPPADEPTEIKKPAPPSPKKKLLG